MHPTDSFSVGAVQDIWTKQGMRTLSSEKTMAQMRSPAWEWGTRYLKKICSFFNTTTIKLARKFNHTFSHIFIFSNVTVSAIYIWLRVTVSTRRRSQASGRGARVSACAGLINQLQRCRFDSRTACLENPDTAIVGDWWTWVGGLHAMNC